MRFTLCHPIYTWAKLPLPISAPTTKSPMWALLYCLSLPEDEACRGSAMVSVDVSGGGVGWARGGRGSSPKAYSIRKTSAAVGFMYTIVGWSSLFLKLGRR